MSKTLFLFIRNLGKDVAKLFGGGGHAKAAGSRFVNEAQFDVINKIFGHQ